MLLELLSTDAVLLVLDTLELTLALLIGKTLLLSLLELLSADTLASLLLALLAVEGIGSSLLLLINDDATSQSFLVLLSGTSQSTCLSGLLGLEASLIVRGVHIHASNVESLGQTGELEASNLGRSVLETLDRANLALGRTGSAAGVHGLGGREDVRVKGQNAGDVINTDSEVALLAAVHDELLDHGGGDLEGVGELGELVDELELD